ncbi:hydroxyacylglutathione hydrolase [Dickeya sp. DW 0440]|uniref:hydroxyacylglutathione hydrolase n=1 Tax=Dickeya sp. DW 0440 TaxID=1225785 RepID=UPI0006864771|nr:hydroxyacylglutathione hydrolase [Dickeya sp. DW 0440]
MWLLVNDDPAERRSGQKPCVIVDPGDAAPVLHALKQHQLFPCAILLTHHHHDHTGGVQQLATHYPDSKIYGPQETQRCGATHIIQEGDIISVAGLKFSIFSIPGHTAGHVAYYSAPYLFCGDTLFSAGCGRIFEGTAQQMFESLLRLADLPDETQICCAHEYTLSNLEFAHHVWPENTEIHDYLLKIRQLRTKGETSLPSTLGLERKINIFLRYHDTDLKRKLSINSETKGDWQIFAHLRTMKDLF